MSWTTTITDKSSRMRLPSVSAFRPNNPWADPQRSIGDSLCSLGRNRCWEAVGPAGELSRHQIFRDIKSLLELRYEYLNEGESVPCALLFEIYMVGRIEAAARPTILFCCERKPPRQRAVKLIRESPILNEHPAILLGDCSRPPTLTRPPVVLFNPRDGQDTPMSNEIGGSVEADKAVYYYPPIKSAFGVPISVLPTNTMTGERNATIGGFISIGERCFGLTVGHVFSSKEAQVSIDEQVELEFSLEDFGSDEDIDEAEDREFVVMTSRGSISPPPLDSDESEPTNSEGSGSCPMDVDSAAAASTSPWTSSNIDPTARKQLGHLCAFSAQSSSENLDWALIEINDADIRVGISMLLANQSPDTIQIKNIANAPTAKDKVFVATAYNGMLNGVISGNSSFMQLPHSVAFQEMWTVHLDGRVGNGDCGSWVMSSKTGTLYGHIVAGDPDAPIAYLIPAFQIFNDIENRLSGTISLPASSASLEPSGTAAPARRIKSEEQVAEKFTGYIPSYHHISTHFGNIEFEYPFYCEENAPTDMFVPNTIRYEDLLLNLMPQGVKIEEAEYDYLPDWVQLPERNESFIGRDHELEEIHKTLSMQAVCCLTGTGGVGKTEMALEYAHRNRESFSEVFWVTTPTIMLLEIIGNTNDDKASIGKDGIKEIASKKWLAILDNVEGGLDIKYLLYKWDLSRGSIIITTRQREFATPAGVLWYRMKISDLVNSYMQDQGGLSLEESVDFENIPSVTEPSPPRGKVRGKKRTKTGCLSCRRRKIKCGEERPTCMNCTRSKRQCEGYNQRVTFRDPSALNISPVAPKPAPATDTYKSMGKLSGDLTSIVPKPSSSLFSSHEILPDTSHVLDPSRPWNINALPSIKHHSPTYYSPLPTPGGLIAAEDPSLAGHDDFWDLSDENNDMVSEIGNRHLKSNNLGIIVALQAGHPLDEKRILGSYASSNFLRSYLPSPSPSPLQDKSTAHIFCHFVNVVGPCLSMYERHPANPSLIFQGKPVPSSQQHIWTYTFSTLALSNPHLLHAILAVSSLQIATTQDAPIAASLKHYALALRKVAKYLTSVTRRSHVTTLAAGLLLCWYELTSADFDKWSNHLLGLRTLLEEIDFEDRTKYIAAKKLKTKRAGAPAANVQRRYDNGFIGKFQYMVESGISNIVLREKAMLALATTLLDDTGAKKEYSKYDIDRYETERDLFWWFCKQDALRSILTGKELFLDFDLWALCPPRAPLGQLSATYGTSDHLILLLGRVAEFSTRDQHRKQEVMRKSGGKWVSPKNSKGIFPDRKEEMRKTTLPLGFDGINPGGESSNLPTINDVEIDAPKHEAEQEWQEIRSVFDQVKLQLGDSFQALGPEYVDSVETPFGEPLFYRTYGIAGIWAMFYMGLIVHARGHPSLPPYALVAAGISSKHTSTYENAIGRVVAGICPELSSQVEVSPGVSAALIETSFALFVAGIMYRTQAERDWTIQRFTDITRVTGWKPALSFARGCESAWIKAYEQGNGPPYVRSPSMKASSRSGFDVADATMDEHAKETKGEEPITSGFTENSSFAPGVLGLEEDFQQLAVDV